MKTNKRSSFVKLIWQGITNVYLYIKFYFSKCPAFLHYDLSFCLIAKLFDAMPLKKGPSRTLTGGMKGEFKRCLNGICDKVYELLFEQNPCFEYKIEVVLVCHFP